MKVVAIIVNFFIPGLGSFFVGKVGQGIAQLLLYIIGIVFVLTGIGAIIGIPLCIGVWIWGLVTAANSPGQPIQVTIVHQAAPNPLQQQVTPPKR
jgi:TM2 domain-containing membrane protein YozV